MTIRFLVGDVRARLAEMPDASVDLVMTSPPFLGLRSYLPGDDPAKVHEIGSEATPADFLDVMLDLTDEWGRVLTPHGSICVEFGDAYAGGGDSGWHRSGDEPVERYRSLGVAHSLRTQGAGWPLDKSLTCIPGLYAASLAYGRNLLRPEHTVTPWRVRNFVAWVRPNPPVGALGDKVRPATSYLTWACRARDRWFDLDAVRTEASPNTHARIAANSTGRHDLPSQQRDGNWNTLEANNDSNPAGAPPLDWWKITPGGFSGAHYAVYPAELCRIPIQASCPRRVCRTCGQPSRRVSETTGYVGADGEDRTSDAASWASAGSNGNRGKNQGRTDGGLIATTTTTGWTTCGCPGTDGIRLDGFHDGDGWRPGIVLDPFGGSGTTAVMALGLSRDAILIDLDARNLDLARERLGMFLEVEDPPRPTEEVATGGLL